MAGKRISMVVISRNERFRLKETVENLEDTLPDGSEILVVDDASTDGSTQFLTRRRGPARILHTQGVGVAKARNMGARRAKGDVLIFADAHLWLPSDWWKPLLDALDHPRVGGVAPAIAGMKRKQLEGYGITFRNKALDVRWLRRKPRGPSPAPILPGCTFAMPRHVFDSSGGWDEGMLRQGNVDNECGVRLWLLGYQLLLVPEVVVKHHFRDRPATHVSSGEYLYNRLRLAFAHFNDRRLRSVVSSLRNDEGFPEALRLIAGSNINVRRRELLAVRKHTDDWFFKRFGLNW